MPRIRKMNTQFHLEFKLALAIVQPLTASRIVPYQLQPIMRCRCFRAFLLLLGVFGDFPAEGFKRLPISQLDVSRVAQSLQILKLRIIMAWLLNTDRRRNNRQQITKQKKKYKKY